MLVADVKLTWKKSTDDKVSRQRIRLTIDDKVTELDIAAGVEEATTVIAASKSFSYEIVAYKDTVASVSEPYRGEIGDLQPPAPATDLTHEILGVRDVADT